MRKMFKPKIIFQDNANISRTFYFFPIFHVFSRTGKMVFNFPGFPGRVGTLTIS